MSDMWTEPTDDGYADTTALDDGLVDAADDYAAAEVYVEDPIVAEFPAEPWVEPVSCCDCSTPGWEDEFYEQIAAAPAAPTTSVVMTAAPTAEFSSWEQVAADPQAAVVTVGEPLSAVAQPDWSVTDVAGQPVDPSTLYPSTITIGGQSLEPAFTVVQPPLEASPTLGTMTIGGTNPFGDFTIVDAAGQPIDPATLYPSTITIGGPTAGLSGFGGSAIPPLTSVLATAIEKGDVFSTMMLNSIIRSQDALSMPWTAPDNVVIHRYV